MMKENVTPEYFKSDPNWEVVVVIPTLYRARFLEVVLRSLIIQSVPAKEVLIIDQSEEGDVQVEMYKAFLNLLPIRVYHLSKKSKPAALNWCLELSRSPIIISIDDDTEFDSDLIFNHLLSLYAHQVDCISGAVVHKNSLTLSSSYRTAPAWESGVYTLGHNPMVNYPCMTLGLAGCNFSIKRSAVLKVNGWDENMSLLDDRDLALYLFKSGAKMYYDPRPKVVHLKTAMGGWRFRKKESTFKLANLFAVPPTGYLYFYRKHFSAQEAIAFCVMMVLRGHPHYAKYRFKTFLKTPFSVLGAIRAWRESSRLIRRGPVYLDPNTRKAELKLIL